MSGDGAAIETGDATQAFTFDRHAGPDMLAAEANHRIANNLSMIAGRVRRQSREVAQVDRVYTAGEVGTMLCELSAHIDSVGRFHRLLAQPASGDLLNLGDYLQGVAAAAIASMARDGEIALRPMREVRAWTGRTQTLLIGLVVAELVTNAAKYAYPAGGRGVLRLGCAERDDGVLILVSDDGAGFPEGVDANRGGGLGLRMARLFCRQMNATLTLASTRSGVTARLFVPADDTTQPAPPSDTQ